MTDDPRKNAGGGADRTGSRRGSAAPEGHAKDADRAKVEKEDASEDAEDTVEEASRESFPASDPPA